jgi:hypothetical protein
VATPDPYQHWSGAPKHWVHVPAQRSGPPGPDELDAAGPSDERGRVTRGELTVAAIALAVAVAAFVLIGTGSAVPSHQPPLHQGTSIR